MKKKNIRIFFISITAWLLFFSSGTTETVAEAKQNVIILPFHIVSSDKPDILQQSVTTLLNSGLSSETCDISLKLTTGKENPSDGLIRKTLDNKAVCQKFQGHFMIYGSIVKLGDSITTNAFLYDAAKDRITLHFNTTGKGDGALLEHIAGFVKKTKPLLSPACFPVNKAAVTPKASTSFTDRILKSHEINGRINGIAIADFDNDGKIDIAIVTDKALTIFSLEGKVFKEKAVITVPVKGYVVGLDVGDVNNNGIPELFVSIVTDDRMDIASLILEWDGKAYKTIRSNLKWLFRSVRLEKNSEPVVVVQKNKNLLSMLGSPIYRFTYQQDPAKGEPLPLPENSPLYSFAISCDGMDTLATLTGNRIRVFDKTKNIRWESEDLFGGSISCMARPDSADRDKVNRLFLEPRILFFDLDNDGTEELFVIKNNETTDHLFSGIKNLNKGRISVLGPSDFGYTTLRETDWISGYISDMTLIDIDMDGIPELIYSVVSKGSFFSAKKSCIIIQKLTEWSE